MGICFRPQSVSKAFLSSLNTLILCLHNSHSYHVVYCPCQTSSPCPQKGHCLVVPPFFLFFFPLILFRGTVRGPNPEGQRHQSVHIPPKLRPGTVSELQGVLGFLWMCYRSACACGSVYGYACAHMGMCMCAFLSVYVELFCLASLWYLGSSHRKQHELHPLMIDIQQGVEN